MTGKAVSIGLIGSPGSGKTFLASMFNRFKEARIVYEDEFHLPRQIFENLKQGKNLFETILWFRNKQLQDHRQTLSLLEKHNLVVTDSTLYQNQLYIDLYLKDDFSRQILKKLAESDIADNKSLDIYIYIAADKNTVRDYLSKKDPSWPLYSDIFFDFISQMADHADAFIKSNRRQIPGLIEIRREEYDFSAEKDFEKLWKIIVDKIPEGKRLSKQ